MLRRLLVILLLSAVLLPVNAQIQGNESELAPKIHSPKKATIFSAVIPGLGQAYNKKYWKIPVIYAGIGTVYYFISTNRTVYLEANEAYNYVSNGSEYPIDNDMVTKFNDGIYSQSDLLQIRDYYRRSLELSWIVMGAWYVLNIIDANVDANFFDYDIDDDLSVNLSPVIETKYLQNSLNLPPSQVGIRLSLRF